MSLNKRNRRQSKRIKTVEITYFQKTLHDSGLILKDPPEKSVALHETIQIKRNIKKLLEEHFDYPSNTTEFLTDLTKKCQDMDIFKQYLYPNIVKMIDGDLSEQVTSDSVIQILLNVTILQDRLIDYLFSKAIDLVVDVKYMSWIQMILRCLSHIEYVGDSRRMATGLINLLEISSGNMVCLDILNAIPDILGDQEHDNIAIELCRILEQEHDLIPAIMDCVSYLSLSDEQYEQVQKKALNVFQSLSKFNFFPNFIKVLLLPGRLNENGYLEAVEGIRNALGWPTTLAKSKDIDSSQVLTAMAIRSSITSSKFISNAWLKVINNCKIYTDHKPIDFVIVLIMYSTSEQKQTQIENLLRNKIKLGVLKEDLLDEAFEKYKPIIKDNLKNLLRLTNVLLKTKADSVVQSFASHTYMLMLCHLEDYCSTIIAELHKLFDCKQVALSILIILNTVASKDISLLKPHCFKMLTMLDRIEDMSLSETRAVMNLVCALTYSYENSPIYNDVCLIIKKELSSSNPSLKCKGILAGVHAVKYLISSNIEDGKSIKQLDKISYLSKAKEFIESLSESTRQYPEMIAFFYDELFSVLNSANKINTQFLTWFSESVTNALKKNFIVCNESKTVGQLKLSKQYCLYTQNELGDVEYKNKAINIAGLALNDNGDVSVEILPSLFKLVQSLHFKQYDGNLFGIYPLLGCPIMMPQFNIADIDDMDTSKICSIIDCLLYCVNWFRELLNAFATQNDFNVREKMLKRVSQIEQIEKLICQILLQSKISYRPPKCFQFAQNLQNFSKNESNIPLRKLSLTLLNLLSIGIQDNANVLTIKTLKFVLKSVNQNLPETLISTMSKRPYLLKQEDCEVYDHHKADECANSVSKILPNLMSHVNYITRYLDMYIDEHILDENKVEFSPEASEYLSCLEYIYNMFTIYFKWTGFKKQHSDLLKSSLRTMAGVESHNTMSLNDCVLNIIKNLQKHVKYCVQISIAISLLQLLNTLQEHCNCSEISKIIRDVSTEFLSTDWKTIDGTLENKKLGIYRKNVAIIVHTYLMNNDIGGLQTITLQLVNDVQKLKNKNDSLDAYQCINKSNFTVFYRNLGNALCEATKAHLNKELTNSEHLALWKDVLSTMKCMTDISKTLKNRNNLSTFFTISQPIIRLFVSHGIPIIKAEFQNYKEESIRVIELLQISTKFLQCLCCQSKKENDTKLMSKVPSVRRLLETVIIRVQNVLDVNKCSKSFRMGNLVNKNIHGERIQIEENAESDESMDDCDDQLPEDENEDSDVEMLDPASDNVSDII